MLYISRYVGGDGFGLMYDDSFEEVVSRQELVKVCTEGGQAVSGVVMRDVPRGPSPLFGNCFSPGNTLLRGMKQKRVDDVLAYQPEDSMSVLQTKLKVVCGIETVVYGDVIANIRWRELKAPVSIRLSELGLTLGDRFLYGDTPPCKYNISLVFDDSVSISEYAFIASGYRGRHDIFGEDGLKLYFDLREVSDSKARLAYSCMLPGHVDVGHLRQLSYDIVDEHHRKEQILQSLCREG